MELLSHVPHSHRVDVHVSVTLITKRSAGRTQSPRLHLHVVVPPLFPLWIVE